jgi:PKD repeat protein
VDINNPLGPDGIPFTADDGLRLLAESVLRGQGEDGVDLGAYITASAGFNASTTNGAVPLTVTFTDASTGVNTNWLWDFGDGGTSSDTNPGYTYSNAGLYTVSLTVGGEDGSSNVTKTNLITVLTPLEAWQMQHFGCTNCPESSAEADPDGDGMDNLQEFLSGTVPTSSASALRIISVTLEGEDLRVTWTMGGGKTNALQAAAGDGGFYTNLFGDIFIVTNTAGSAANYLDVGATTNVPSRFYRVRLVP